MELESQLRANEGLLYRSMTWVRVKVPVDPDHPVSVHQAMQLGG